jgi:hypothetical protein
MFNDEVRKLLIGVISSWQVLAVTIVLIIYFTLFNYVSKDHVRRPRSKALKPRKKEKPAAAPATQDSDELDLEEDSEESATPAKKK